MRKSLSAKFIESIGNTADRRLELWDTILPGFGVRISKSGKKSWFVIIRDNQRQRRITLGRFPIMQLAEAREKARILLRESQLGLSFVAPLQLSETLGEVIERFIEIYAKPKNRGWKESERLLQKFSELFDVPIRSIKRPHVVSVLDAIVANGTPYRANRALAALKKVFSWALDRGIIDIHPILGLQPPSKEFARERVLSNLELGELLNAIKVEGYPFGDLFRLLIFTGQRRGEVTGMRWSEVDLERRVWTIPAARSKNGQSHDVPLSDSVWWILNSLPRFMNSDLVFSTTGVSAVSGFGRAKRRLDAAMRCFDWRTHDLRRTVASGMARSGISPHVVEKVLNHRSGIISGVAAVYNRYGYENEKRSALESWAHYLKQLAKAHANSGNHKNQHLVGHPEGGAAVR